MFVSAGNRKRRAEGIDVVSSTTKKKIKPSGGSVPKVANTNTIGNIRTKAHLKLFEEQSPGFENNEAISVGEKIGTCDHTNEKHFYEPNDENAALRFLQPVEDTAPSTWIVHCDSMDEIADVDKIRQMGNLILDDIIIGNAERIIEFSDLQVLEKRMYRAAILEKHPDVSSCKNVGKPESEKGIWSIDCFSILISLN